MEMGRNEILKEKLQTFLFITRIFYVSSNNMYDTAVC